MIEPERRREIKRGLVEAIERADPSRVGRADAAAEGLILIAEVIPRIAEAVGRSRTDEGTEVPIFDVARGVLDEYRSGRMGREPGHEARTEQLLSKALDDLGRGPRGDRVSGAGVTEGDFTKDEHEAMRLINEAIRRSRRVDIRGPAGEG